MNATIGAAGGTGTARVNPLTTVITTADLPEAERFDFWREALSDTFIGGDYLPTSEQAFFGEFSTTPVREVTFSRMRARGYKYVRTPRWIRKDREETLYIPLVLSGSCLLMQDGRKAELGPGDFTCFDSTRPYSGTISDDWELLQLHLPRDTWIRKFGPTEQVTARTVRSNTYMGALFSNFLRQAMSGIGSITAATADHLAEPALAMVAAAFGNLISQQEPGQSSARMSLLYRAKALIEVNLHDPDLNPEKIARALGISERYLQDIFHEENSTVSNWIWDRRIEKSRQSLCDPLLANLSVSRIAFNCGFSDMTHFGRRFKATFSVTPSEFRRARLAVEVQSINASSSRAQRRIC